MTVSPDNAERLRHNVAMLQQVGVNTQVITAQELQELQLHARSATSLWLPRARERIR